MRPARDPAQHIFGADDGHQEGLGGPVDGRGDDAAARLYQTGDCGEEEGRVGCVLDHLERQHGIEAVLLLQQILRRRFAVIDGETGILGMAARYGDRPRVGIDSGDGKSQPGQRLGDDAAAASDIE